jgi:hypothetical protein
LQREGLRVGGRRPGLDLFRASVPTPCHRLTLLFPTVAAAPSPDSCRASCPCVLRHVRGCDGSRPAPPHRGSPAATRPFHARPVVVRSDLRPVPGQHGADRLDSPFLVVIDRRDYHGKRRSSLFDPLHVRRRRPTAPTRIDIGLLHPRAQRFRIHPPTRSAPAGRSRTTPDLDRGLPWTIWIATYATQPDTSDRTGDGSLRHDCMPGISLGVTHSSGASSIVSS